jgi:hypothetical protein
MTNNNTTSTVYATILINLGYTTCFDPKGSSSVVSNYTYLLIGLQRELHIFLFTYTGHEAATLMFIYILFGHIDACEITVLT